MDRANAFDRACVATRYLLAGEESLCEAAPGAADLAEALAAGPRRRRAEALAEALSEIARALEARAL